MDVIGRTHNLRVVNAAKVWPRKGVRIMEDLAAGRTDLTTLPGFVQCTIYFPSRCFNQFDCTFFARSGGIFIEPHVLPMILPLSSIPAPAELLDAASDALCRLPDVHVTVT
jgi:hypothetical protein